MLKENKTIIFCTLIISLIQMTSSASINQTSPTSSNSGLFAADLLGQIAKNRATENIIFSPISIQTALAMTYLGAAGKTAEELKNVLRLPSTDKDQVGEYFAQLLQKKTGEANLTIANRIFVSSSYQLQDDFNKKTEKYFNSGAEALNFKDMPSEAIEAINTWVENKTNNKITNLMKPGSVNDNTVALIVNAVYFKGKWDLPFSSELTQKSPFWISKDESIDVDTMVTNERDIKYGEFPELDATAVELPYKNSDMSMVLILPSKKDGLAELERKLGSFAINELSSKMTIRELELMIPKFKIEFSIGLSDVLKEMGIRSLFDKAVLPGIFQSKQNVKVSDVQHKAFIDVNEAGSEAAAALFVELQFYSLNNEDVLNFVVDRPFVFAIKDSNTIYFAGHVVKI